MKKYERPEWAMAAFDMMDVLMASDENETDKDYVDNESIVVENIANI
ncbi:MAG: hypothetical protein IJY20_04460 [Clostridia bacterium]|nr:hypothetical protein [Clostridia bacterium]